MHTQHTTISWLSEFCLGQPRWAGTRKKHSPTHTYHGHQSSLILFLHVHVLWSLTSSLFNLRAWQMGSLKTLSWSRESIFIVLISSWKLLSWSCVSNPRQFKISGYWKNASITTHYHFKLVHVHHRWVVFNNFRKGLSHSVLEHDVFKHRYYPALKSRNSGSQKNAHLSFLSSISLLIGFEG